MEIPEGKKRIKITDSESDDEEDIVRIIYPTDDFEDDNNAPTKWKFPCLYKDKKDKDTGNSKEKNKRTDFWQIEFNGKELVTTHGMVGGKPEVNHKEVIPKASRSINEQARQEARTKYKNQYITQGYRPKGDYDNIVPKPMAGYIFVTNSDYEKAQKCLKKYGNSEDKEDVEKMLLAGLHCTKKVSKKKDDDEEYVWKLNPAWKRLSKDDYPVLCMCKFDGIRLLVSENGIRTKLSNKVPHLTHIENDIADFFAYLPPGSELDSEGYRPGWSFSRLTSVYKRQKTVSKSLQQISIYIFDIILPDNTMSYENRYSLLYQAFMRYKEDNNKNTSFFLVPISVANSDEDVVIYRDKYIDMGYEGAIIRRLSNKKNNCIYESKRSINVLKYKKFYDDEAEVVSIKEGTGKHKGVAVLRVKDESDREFNVALCGPLSYRKIIFKNKKSYIGKLVTYSYQELNESGVPRFATAKCFRDYE